MQVFYHLVYEYQKGLRDLCLYTCSSELEEKITESLEKRGIDYLVCPIENKKINIFFGITTCLKIIKQFACNKLNKLSAEQDFIMGIMLGYSRLQQYERFLIRKTACV